jgi:phosphate transport system substrate-binding protein
VEDSLTSGRISVVCSPELLDILQRERAAFDSLYPGATIELKEGTSTEAIRSLFAAESDLAAISRDLDPIERGAAVRGGLELEGFRFARDGVALVTHRGNTVENVALDEVRALFAGSLTRWEALGGSNGRIQPVIQAPNSDIMAYFAAAVLHGEPIVAPVVYQQSDSGVAAYVAGHPEAVGIVSMAWAERGVRPLRLARLKGLSYRRPDAETVHEGEYPLARDMHLYVRPRGPALANGFITFITSRDGQVIVRDQGLVPASVPVRFVRRSPMVGSHR